MGDFQAACAAIAGGAWSYWVGGAGPLQMRFSLDRLGNGYQISEGASEFERSWNFQRTPTGVCLTVWGDHGGPTFHATWNGEEFSGEWLDRKNSRIRLVPQGPINLTFPGGDQPLGEPSVEPFYVGIPTLHCYDLCRLAVDAVLNSSVLPEAVFVIDNGCDAERFSHPHPLVSIIRPGRNLGVARSWNLLHHLAAPHPLVILNDDASIGRNCLERLLRCGQPFACLDERRAYESFLIRESVWSIVGEFDETFWPAYHEDGDHARRLQLAGIKIACPENQGVLQRGPSATKQRMTEDQRRELDRNFDLGREYYVRKWGGIPQQEIFESPFNRIR